MEQKVRGLKGSAAAKVLLVGEHELALIGLESILRKQREFLLIGIAGIGCRPGTKSIKGKPDLIVLAAGGDIQEVRKTVDRIQHDWAPARIVIFAFSELTGKLSSLLETEVCGYLPREASVREVVLALSRVKRGEFYFSPAFFNQLRRQARHEPEAPSRLDRLTKSERAVLSLIATGLSNKEMAQHLGISVRTVEKHRQTVMDKVGIRSVAGLTRLAIQEGLVSLEG